MSRKLASIQRVRKLLPIEGADKIEKAIINSWPVVVQKGLHNEGDLVVYCEPDSFLPIKPEYEFLRATSYKKMGEREGFRLKTIRLKKQLSQGLILPLRDTGLDRFFVKEGMDVTELLGIVQYETVDQSDLSLSGDIASRFPSFIRKTDEERIQNLTYDFEEWKKQGMEFIVTEKLHGCFTGKQYLKTYDGDTIQMIDIVNGARPDLIGVNFNGDVVRTKITNIFSNGLKSDWVKIYYNSLGRNYVGGRGKLITTPNHKLFTSNMKEVNASEINIDDEILMNYSDYSPNGIHYFKSSLLGDGCVSSIKRSSYNEGHAVKHDLYNEYILDIFKDVETSYRFRISGYGSKMKDIKVFSSFELKNICKEWYQSGKKKLPKDISWIDDFSIAKWYMDDGSISNNKNQNSRANFATNAFSKEDVERLVNKLKEMYGVDAVQYNAKGWRIRINYNDGSIHNFWKSIAPHIHPSMRYKIPEEYREVDFQHYGYVQIEQKFRPVKIIKTEVLTNKTHQAYDIETETHNYFCGGILVHNSSATYYRKDGEFGVCSRNYKLKETEYNAHWDMARKLKIQEWIPDNHVIQGEMIGPKICGNIYRLTETDFYAFNAFDLTQNLNENRVEDFQQYTKIVPIIGITKLPETIEDLLLSAEGKSVLSPNSYVEREGLVYRRREGGISYKDVSFKAISNKWLLGNYD